MRARAPLALMLFCLSIMSAPLAAQPWEPGREFVGSLKVDRVVIPLPEGTWVVAGNQIWRNDANTPLLNIWLVQIDEGVMRGVIWGWVSTEYAGRGYAISETCNRTNMHFIEKFANYDGKEQDCYWINHWRMTLSNPNKADLQARRYIESQGVRFPGAMLSAGYRFADRGRYMELNYAFNPELTGFPPAKRIDWDVSDWHPDNIITDQNRKAYIQSLIDWATEVYPTVKAGFKGNTVESKLPSIIIKLDSVEMSAPLVPTLEGQESTTVVPESVDEKYKSVEDRLRELKSLQTRGLISDEEAADKRIQILNDL